MRISALLGITKLLIDHFISPRLEVADMPSRIYPG
jgi:hypothetical protein